MIEAGKFPAQARSVQFGHSSNGTPQVVVEFQLLGGPNKGQHITWFGSFSPKAEDHTFKALAVMGWPKGVALHELKAEHIAGMVDVVIEQDEYQGKLRSRVRWINRPGGSGIKLKAPLVGDELAAFSARMAAKAEAVPRFEPAPVTEAVDDAPAESFDSPPPIDDDDRIPF